jgi:hypothetical protein
MDNDNPVTWGKELKSQSLLQNHIQNQQHLRETIDHQTYDARDTTILMDHHDGLTSINEASTDLLIK